MTHRHELFLEEYFKCFNSNEAAKKAGYANYRVEAARIMKKQFIIDEIALRKKELREHSKWTVDKMIEELNELYYETKGNVRSKKDALDILKEIAKLNCLYEPEKIKIEGLENIIIKIVDKKSEI